MWEGKVCCRKIYSKMHKDPKKARKSEISNGNYDRLGRSQKKTLRLCSIITVHTEITIEKLNIKKHRMKGNLS